jgi:hypothetical protein
MFINIYFSSNLAEDIDSYVKVYNHIKKNSLFLQSLIFIKIDYIVSLWPYQIKAKAINDLCNHSGLSLPYFYLSCLPYFDRLG